MRVTDMLQKLGALRDGILVVASFTYVAGLVTWGLYAWHRGLGTVPAVDAQYFVIGGCVVAIFAIVAALILILRKMIVPWWRDVFYKQQLVTRFAIALFVATIAFAVLLLGLRAYASLPKAVATATLIVCLFLSYIANILTPRIHADADVKREEAKQLFVLFIMLPVLAIVSVWMFITVIYGSIPQALGGGRPRYAQLDVRQDQLSGETLREIGIPLSSATHGVARSRPVAILVSRPDMVIVAVPKQLKQQENDQLQQLEIERAAIVAVRWFE